VQVITSSEFDVSCDYECWILVCIRSVDFSVEVYQMKSAIHLVDRRERLAVFLQIARLGINIGCC